MTMKKSFEQEVNHLENMVNFINNYFNKITRHRASQTAEIIESRAEMVESYSNVVDYEDGDIMDFMSELPNIRIKEMQFTRTSELLEFLQSIINKPYFGKLIIDNEEVYIGNMTFRDDDHNILIYDWRTPVAGLFYENIIGQLSYKVPNGETIEANVSERRQFIIENSKLLNMFDSDMYIGDEVLQRLLTDTSQTKLKNIVTTIQAEQNVIIRQPLAQDTLVFGPPGSGKTSLAMQRIAYLLYHHRDSLSADKILLLNPNEVFNDYLSDVLPELGEDNVESSTFFTIKNKIPYLRSRKFEGLTENMRRLEIEDHTSYKYKNSMFYLEHLEEYLFNLTHKNMYFRTLMSDEGALISREQLKHDFYQYANSVNIRARIFDMRKKLIKMVNNRVKLKTQSLYNEMKESDKYIGEDHELKQEAHKKAVKMYKKVHRMILHYRFVHIENIYINSLTHKNTRLETIDSIKQNNYKYEDLGPMLLIIMYITDVRDTHIRHVLVDEVQDYSNVQFKALKTYFSRATFTSLGDLNQRLHPAAIDPLNLKNQVQKYLVQSYRSTNQINEYLNTIKPNSIESVSVDGDEVQHINYTDLIQSIETIITNNDNQIAIITPSRELSTEIYEQIKDKHPTFKHLQDEDTIYNRNHLILPYYLAKGFEFNTVIVVDSDEYSDRQNVHYVLASRATRHLYLLNKQ